MSEGFGKTLELEKVEGGESDHGQESVEYQGWKSMPFVIGNETFEKLGTIGTMANQLVYLTTVFHMDSVTAATMMNIVFGTTNMTPVLGAFISDTFLGRYTTIAFASVASLLSDHGRSDSPLWGEENADQIPLEPPRVRTPLPVLRTKDSNATLGTSRVDCLCVGPFLPAGASPCC